MARSVVVRSCARDEASMGSGASQGAAVVGGAVVGGAVVDNSVVDVACVCGTVVSWSVSGWPAPAVDAAVVDAVLDRSVAISGSTDEQPTTSSARVKRATAQGATPLMSEVIRSVLG